MEFAGGVYDKSVAAAQDYVSGPVERQIYSATGGKENRPGFKSGDTPAAKDLNKTLDTGIKYFDKGINKSKDFIERKIEEIFPEFATNSISKSDKKN